MGGGRQPQNMYECDVEQFLIKKVVQHSKRRSKKSSKAKSSKKEMTEPIQGKQDHTRVAENDLDLQDFCSSSTATDHSLFFLFGAIYKARFFISTNMKQEQTENIFPNPKTLLFTPTTRKNYQDSCLATTSSRTNLLPPPFTSRSNYHFQIDS